jgi:hypothetical protein
MTAEQAMGRIKELLHESQKSQCPCCVCGRPTLDRGVFIPTNSREWGGLPQKQRVVVYPMCDLHDPQDEFVDERIEEAIREFLTGPKFSTSMSA